MSKFFDLRAIIMIAIGGGILSSMLLLIGVVLCLYSKVTKALNSAGTAKEADAAASCIVPSKLTQDKIILAKPITEPCRTVQCCDACSVYADVGAVPPCFCSISEGL
ncbi:protein FAM24A-like [Phodopus roborovskii]|uniref:Fam24b protein n=1 Tax=Phodopus roborovskii TaxID=109678 RepID=A0AAU9ZL75_PHORO|nr:protein FAM24A-like [Phodopus roborovskii]CAH6793226.1 Fam24b [Phodopus roborovskii]